MHERKNIRETIMGRKPIEDAIKVLSANLKTTARVNEWAELMGYNNPRLFSRRFLRHFKIRPSLKLTEVRIKSIIEELRSDEKTNLGIAWAHSLPDEKAFYNYLKRHLDHSPTEIREMSLYEVQELMENSGSKKGE